jgi:hypothetical protein
VLKWGVPLGDVYRTNYFNRALMASMGYDQNLDVPNPTFAVQGVEEA